MEMQHGYNDLDGGYGNGLISELIPHFFYTCRLEITRLYLLDILGRVLSDSSNYM